MAIFNALDVGQFSLNQGPSSGQVAGSDFVDGQGAIEFARGGKAQVRSTVINVMAPYPIGAAAADSRQAVRYAVQQLVEMATNKDQQPVYIQWESGGGQSNPNPYDGWYRLDDVTPLDWRWNRHVPCQVTATLVAPAPPARLGIWHSGGALSTDASGPAKNLVTFPYQALTLESGFNRVGAEGAFAYPSVLNPVMNPTEFSDSFPVSDYFKGRVRIFDTIDSTIYGVPKDNIATVWHSLGTEAGTDNSILYWTVATAGASYAAHIVTMDGLNQAGTLRGGNPDWGIGHSHSVRVRCPTLAGGTGGFAYVTWRWKDGSNFIESAFRGSGGGNFLSIEGPIAGSWANYTSTGAFAFTPGNWYWLVGTWTGVPSAEVLTVSVYNDNAIAKGTFIGSITYTFTGSQPSTGRIQIHVGATAGVTLSTTGFGGAGANVCTVTGPMPANSAMSVALGNNGGEPAYCLSTQQAYQGSYSISIYNEVAGGAGVAYLVSGIAAGTYTFSAQIRGTGTPSVFGLQIGSGGAQSGNATADSTWRQLSVTGPRGVEGNLYCLATGAGTYYFDLLAVTDASGKTVAADSFEYPFNANWVEVFDTHHKFQGDCVLTNGLALLHFRVGIANQFATAYVWNTALAWGTWQQYTTVIWADNVNGFAILRSYSLTRVGPEECSLTTTNSTVNGKVAEVVVRLQRGRYETRLSLRPKVEANTANWAFEFNLVASPRFLYNSVKTCDNPLSEVSPTPSTDFLYGAAFANSVGVPVIAGFLYQKKPSSYQPTCFNNSPSIGLGDTSGPLKDEVRNYAIFGIPFGVAGQYSPADLQFECESGVVGAFVSVADGAASAGNAAKLPNGTAANLANKVDSSATFTPAAGTYYVVVRYRNSGVPTNATEVQFSPLVAGSVPGGSTVSFGSATGSVPTYAWARSGPITVNGTQTLQLHISNGGVSAASVDWFFDEFGILPATLSGDNRGPQDLAQTYLYDREAKLIRL